ncbi:MAG: transposase [Candidatus Freyarchaeota archaeon]|nr:transposase [Candidatus Jordarchaeia archaeon]
MNRRIHAMPFRKIQSYVSYKSMECGFKPEFVKAKSTSKRCPICGGISKPNGHAFKCKRCGFQADRHLVAAWNIAEKAEHIMCRPLPLAAKATREALKAEVERIVIKKLTIRQRLMTCTMPHKNTHIHALLSRNDHLRRVHAPISKYYWCIPN